MRTLTEVFSRWFAELAKWLFVEAWPGWRCLSIVALAVLCGWIGSSHWESGLRIAGLVLQLAGIGTVALGLHETRKLFRLPELGKLMTGWVKRVPRPRFSPAQHGILGSVTVSTSVSAVLAKGVSLAPAAASLEERIASLEKAVRETSSLVHDALFRVGQENTDRAAALEVERRERTAEDESTRKLIEEAAAGGLFLEITGLVWLFLGVVLATASTELACLLGG